MEGFVNLPGSLLSYVLFGPTQKESKWPSLQGRPSRGSSFDHHFNIWIVKTPRI